MHHRLWSALFLTVAMACAPSAAPMPGTPPSIEGRITATQIADGRGTIRVEAVPDDSAGSAKAVVTISTNTEIRRSDAAASWSALESGQWVRVWFTGPVRESYPVQANAAFVQIDPDR